MQNENQPEEVRNLAAFAFGRLMKQHILPALHRYRQNASPCCFTGIYAQRRIKTNDGGSKVQHLFYTLEKTKTAYVYMSFADEASQAEAEKYLNCAIRVRGTLDLSISPDNPFHPHVVIRNADHVTFLFNPFSKATTEDLERLKALRKRNTPLAKLFGAKREGRRPRICVISAHDNAVDDDFFKAGLELDNPAMDPDIDWEVVHVRIQAPLEVAAAVKSAGSENDIVVLIRGGGAESLYKLEHSPEVILAAIEAPACVVVALGHTHDTGRLSQFADVAYETPTKCGAALKRTLWKYRQILHEDRTEQQRPAPVRPAPVRAGPAQPWTPAPRHEEPDFGDSGYWRSIGAILAFVFAIAALLLLMRG